MKDKRMNELNNYFHSKSIKKNKKIFNRDFSFKRHSYIQIMQLTRIH
jgi:hypothetical protein